MRFYPLDCNNFKIIMESNMEIPIYKFATCLEDPQFLPTRGEPKATGWDVRASLNPGESLTILPMEHVKIPLGFRAFCPEGWWLELRPRSSTFGKKNLHSLYGVIDETYSGQLLFACQYIPQITIVNSLKYGYIFGVDRVDSQIEAEPLVINHGDAIGQIVPIKRQEMIVSSVSNEEYEQLCKERNAIRKDGGFGSTGA